MTFDKWFQKQDKLIQIILLLIPFVGWIVEMLVRWSAFLRKSSGVNLLMAIIFTFCGWAWIPGLLDLIFIALYNKQFLLE